ncbi:hypothetical protein HK097_001659 [Rhizophlyctis rosea]|uniref:Microtubule-associated protein n=1 Tax=Rhizophlyctis rosea TaxID=64517 RepID=A0AAD5X0N4_9FUNG|nr:hypothetical protein HK097_001659 [Rhizophlyctis rosea]
MATPSKTTSRIPTSSTPRGSQSDLSTPSPRSSTLNRSTGTLDRSKSGSTGSVQSPTSRRPPQVSSGKVGSLENVTHSPGGGTKKVFSEGKKDYSNVKSRIGSMENVAHRPAGGQVKIASQKLDFKDKVKSKIGSLDNISHTPGGGNVQIKSEKVDFKDRASSKVGSKDNLHHVPAGGNVKIRSEKLTFKDTASSRIDASPSSSRRISRANSERTASEPALSPEPQSADGASPTPADGNA